MDPAARGEDLGVGDARAPLRELVVAASRVEKVRMGIDEARQDDSAAHPTLDRYRVRADVRLAGAEADDLPFARGDPAALDHPAAIEGHDARVVHDEIDEWRPRHLTGGSALR